MIDRGIRPRTLSAATSTCVFTLFALATTAACGSDRVRDDPDRDGDVVDRDGGPDVDPSCETSVEPQHAIDGDLYLGDAIVGRLSPDAAEQTLALVADE